MSDLHNLHLLRPELTFSDSFRVSGKLKRHITACLLCALAGLIIGLVAGFAILLIGPL
jgi:hypothetical protein